MSKHRNSAPVRIVASVKLVPSVLSLIPKTIKEKSQAFADNVNNEVESRKAAVQSIQD